MANSAHFIGIDINHEQLILTLTDECGTVVEMLSRTCAGSGKSGKSIHDQNPQDWWRSLRTGLKDLLRRSNVKAVEEAGAKAGTVLIDASTVRGVGICGRADTLVMLGKDAEVLCPAVMGSGPGSALEGYAQKITELAGERNLFNITNRSPHDAAMAAGLLWAKENEKRVWHDLTYALSSRDFLRMRLTGVAMTDASTAARSLLMNNKARAWSKQLCMRLGVNPACLPAIQHGQLIAGRVTAIAAKETGLQVGTPVITGGNHIASSAIAHGITGPNEAIIELGGTGSLFATTDASLRDNSKLLQGSAHCLPDVWALEGRDVVTDHGINWLLREVATAEHALSKRTKQRPLDVLAEQAAAAAPGADGLFFLQPEEGLGVHQGRGSFVGLNYEHTHGHLIRAVLESGALSLHGMFLHLRELGCEPTRLILTGPGASNNLWCQIITDAVGCPSEARPLDQPGVVGAALLAASAAGIHKSLESTCKKHQKAADKAGSAAAQGVKRKPRTAATKDYAKLFPIAQQLRERIGDAFAGVHATAEVMAADDDLEYEE